VFVSLATMSHVRKHAALLRTIAKARPDLRRSLLEMADKELIRCICEISDNTLKGHVILSSRQKQKLSRYKKILRRIAKRGESWNQKKRIIQSGSGFIVPLLAAVLGPIISSLIK
jgi:hypothetical protein